jgi:hypothetical protein
MNRPSSPPRLNSPLSGSETAALVALLLAQLVVIVPTSVVLLFSSFSADACSDHPCDYALGGVSLYLTPIAAVVIVIVSIPITVYRAKRDRSPLVPPLSGLVLVVLIGILAIYLNHVAFAG